MNKDITKWHKEIGNYIKSKNINNYEFIFLVPNGSVLHEYGHDIESERLARLAAMFESALLSEALSYPEPYPSLFVDKYLDEMRRGARELLLKRINKLKTGGNK